MMQLLVLTAFYPIPGGTHERMFVHERNRYYQENGARVTVLNFASATEYTIDGIRVISLQKFQQEEKKYDIVISHSANVRNHYLFLKRYEKHFERLVFFFHGHEASIFAKDYPMPYDFSAERKLRKRFFRFCYDHFKLKVWKNFYKSLAHKSQFVFVSEHFYKRVQKNMKISPGDLKNHCHIIHNRIGSCFEQGFYDKNGDKKYDYICIRSNLDASQYCVDLFVALAGKYPAKKFLLIGKGRIFEFIQRPQNLTWIGETKNHEEILSCLNQSKCAVMLTRTDTQGVMSCEMASYGIPVITSDIEVCGEILGEFSNVAFVPNDVEKIDLEGSYRKLKEGLSEERQERYFIENTVRKEMMLFHSMMK